MKLSRIILLSCIAFLYTIYAAAQHSAYSIGFKGGFGASVPDPSSALNVNGQSYSLRTHAFYSVGFLGQYVLANKLGVEAGFLNTYTSYSRKDLSGPALFQSLGWGVTTIVNSYQVPIQVMYIFRVGINPKIRIKLTAGIAMAWHTDNYFRRQANPAMISTILVGARIQDRIGRYGRLEYGFEYQHSPYGKYTFQFNTYNGGNTLHTKYSVLSFNLYYFFFNKYK